MVARHPTHAASRGCPSIIAKHSLCITDLLMQADDELENPILAGFEWDKDESWTRLVVHQKKEGAAPSKKSKKNKAEDD